MNNIFIQIFNRLEVSHGYIFIQKEYFLSLKICYFFLEYFLAHGTEKHEEWKLHASLASLLPFCPNTLTLIRMAISGTFWLKNHRKRRFSL
jgi:hypothetical protein